ncbi:hypothetical protein V6N11_055472 [Hibiscus sabdariffa]|uniref:Uncharacterized protein n=1 Tax=Hibiscus sabdariffa TaxID=183260 RepID=A0ABR2PFG2_9ROSI
MRSSSSAGTATITTSAKGRNSLISFKHKRYSVLGSPQQVGDGRHFSIDSHFSGERYSHERSPYKPSSQQSEESRRRESEFQPWSSQQAGDGRHFNSGRHFSGGRHFTK